MSIMNFRIYDRVRKEMFDVTEIKYCSNGTYVKYDSSVEWISVTDNNNNNCVMVGSGILDKNGVEIFESDIVVADAQCPGGKDFKGVVRFYECGFFIDDVDCAIPLFDEVDTREVVGNIHKS